MKLTSCYIDKKTLREIGHELWLLRNQHRMYLHTVANLTNLPDHIIEGMEIGKFLQYSAFRRLSEFYGVKMRIVFEKVESELPTPAENKFSLANS